MTSLFCLALLLITGEGRVTVSAQEPASFKREWRHYTSTDNINTLLLQGDYIWAGTTGGVVRYNSKDPLDVLYYNSANSGLPHNEVRDIYLDSQGNLWFATAGGLGELRRDGSWCFYYTLNSELPSDNVFSLSGDGAGGIWVGTAEGVAHLNPKREWTIFKGETGLFPQSKIFDIAVDEDWGAWFATAEGLFHASYATLPAERKWKMFNSLNSYLPSDIITAVAIDRAGRKWLAVHDRYGGTLCLLDPRGSWSFLDAEGAGLKFFSVRDIFIDKNDGVWIATWGEGAVYIPTKDLFKSERWQVYTRENSPLPGENITAVAADLKGTIWLGTSKGLLSLSPDGTWQLFRRFINNLPHNDVLSLASDRQGLMLLGTGGGGLALLSKEGKVRVYNSYNAPLPSDTVRVILTKEDQSIWLGTGDAFSGGIACLDAGGSWRVYTPANSPLPHHLIQAGAVDLRGGLWWGTPRGAAYFSPEGIWSVFGTPHLPHADVLSIAVDGEGGVWFATPGGAARYSPPDKWEHFTAANSGLPSDYIDWVYVDGQGEVWFGTRRGVAHLRRKGQVELFPPGVELPYPGVHCLISEDPPGYKWLAFNAWEEGGVATGAGRLERDGSWKLYVSRPALLYQPQNEGVMVAYSQGLPHDRVNTLYFSPEGEIWFATSGGVGVFTPALIRVFIDEKELVMDELPLIEDDRVLLPAARVLGALGYRCFWLGEEKMLYAERGRSRIALRMGDDTAMVNGERLPVNPPARIIEGRVFAPARFLAKALFKDIHWDEARRHIYFYTR